MRSNTIDLLSQLSEVGLVEYKTKIMASKAVRMDLKQREPHVGRHRAPTAMPDAPIEVEGSSNLFYYLFEDYASGVSILNQSREILADLVCHTTFSFLILLTNEIDEPSDTYKRMASLSEAAFQANILDVGSQEQR